jgi:nicotinate-nucleotide pyrophosphorylase (carboxylating)
MTDPRALVFASITDTKVTAVVVAEEAGIIVHTPQAAAVAAELTLTVDGCAPEGSRIHAGQALLRVTGNPLAIALADERLIGTMAKASGIATAARRFVDRAAGSLRIVSGAWKKLPVAHKEMIRSAIAAGSAEPRIAQWPFVYLDKNFVRMLGGVKPTLDAVAAQPGLSGYRRVVQVCEPNEAVVAARSGAGVIFVDTGRLDDLTASSGALRAAGVRDGVELAFGGGVTLDQIDVLRTLDVDVVDIGRPIVDAPLLNMSLRVVGTE